MVGYTKAGHFYWHYLLCGIFSQTCSHPRMSGCDEWIEAAVEYSTTYYHVAGIVRLLPLPSPHRLAINRLARAGQK